MTALVVTIFVSSLAGSLHCAGMCGAFMLFAVGAGEARRGSWTLHASYHVGRLCTYLMFGLAAGIAGAGLEWGGRLVGLQRGAAAFAAVFMVGMGLIMLLRSRGTRVPKLPIPAVMRRVAERGCAAASERPPALRAFGTGLVTTLLPCGWLYMFVVAAAGTGHPLKAMAVMAVFWVGTLPALVTLAVGARSALGPLARRAPAIAALAIIAVGVYTFVDRVALIDRTPSMLQAAQAAEHLDATEAPCCDAND